MIEWLTEMLVQTCVCLMGFACGALWMRENYLGKIKELLSEIDRLTQYAKR
jgi:hypothetical protein